MNARNLRVWVNLAFFSLLLAIMVGWTVRNVVSVDQIDKPYLISAEFPNAFGVLPNAEVTYLGVSYGSVTDVERVPGGVEVTMEIARDNKIPDGSTASIQRKSAIGEQYVDFSPPPGYDGDGGPFYEAGAEIPRELTSVPLEFSELLRSASGLISAIPPEDARTVVHELAVGLEGRSDDLVALADAGDRLSATFAERTELLDRLATNNTELTRTVTEHRGSLGSSLTDLRLVAGQLRESKAEVELLLERGAAFLGQTADVIARQKGNIDCSLKILEQLVDETTTKQRLDGLRTLLDFGPLAFGRVYDARDLEADGAWLRVGFVANNTNAPPQFVPPKTPPSVRPIPPCVSPLRAAGVDYRPGMALVGGQQAASLPATGAAGGAGAGSGLLAAALVARRIGRRVRSRG